MNTATQLASALLDSFKSLSAYAVFFAALWTLYKHRRGRTFEPKLLLEINTTVTPFNAHRMLFTEITLRNIGNGKLEAKQVGPDEYVYKDDYERLRYSCSLQVRRVQSSAIKEAVFLDWYRCSALEQVPHIPAEIDLLDDYRDFAEKGKTVFWLEPNDAAHLSASLILPPGHYLLKVSFYGPDVGKDFWSHQVAVHLA